MKKIIFIFALMLSTICLAWDNQMAQLPETNFRSVNTYNSGTSYTPHITPVGSTQVHPTNNCNYGMARRNVDADSDPNDPFKAPIGDPPMICMIVLCIIYLLIARKKRVD